MPNQRNRKRAGMTRFTAVPIGSADECLEWFGNYTPEGLTPMILMPSRSSCKPWVVVPEGAHAVITKHGKFLDVWKPGIHCCLPWTKI